MVGAFAQSNENKLTTLIQRYDLKDITPQEIPDGVQPLVVNSIEEFEKVIEENKQADIESTTNLTNSESEPLNTESSLVGPLSLWPTQSGNNVYTLYNKYPMAVLVSDINYTYNYVDSEGYNRISGVSNKSIYFTSSLSCSWSQQSYTATVSSDYKKINVSVLGNIYQTIEYNGNFYQNLVTRINTTYSITP